MRNECAYDSNRQVDRETERQVMKVRMVRKTCMVYALTGWLILCAGCGTTGNADMARDDHHETAGREMAAQEENGNSTLPRSGSTGGNGNSTASRTGNTASGSRDVNSAQTGTAAVENVGWADLQPEERFSFEKKSDQGEDYLVIIGFAEENRELFERYAVEREEQGYRSILLQIPEKMGGMPVREIGKEAFADMGAGDMEFQLPGTVTVIGDGAFRNTAIYSLDLPPDLAIIGEEAFRNTGIRSLDLPPCLEVIGAKAFENCGLERIQLPGSTVTVGDRAFAGNKNLWTALVSNVETALGKDVFADSKQGGRFLLCHGENPEGRNNLVSAYAEEYGYEHMEIILSREPIVHYYEEIPVLQPRVGNFFYGEDGDEETEQWCSWEYDENAPNFGYDDWQWPGCSSWCGAMYFEQEAEAASELASNSDRYSAENVLEQSRMAAWAEGVEGYGIGESITYRQTYAGLLNNKWEAMGPEYREPVIDGFIRYTEICIVNGYAKDMKTWEENGRIKTLLMYVEDKPYARLELEDTILPQYFALPEDDIKVLNGGTLEARFEIAEVYPGSVYEDTCLTGLIMEFSGRFAH